jgi:hypothetical protein
MSLPRGFSGSVPRLPSPVSRLPLPCLLAQTSVPFILVSPRTYTEFRESRVDSEIDRPAPAIEGVARSGELSPVPGWVGIVRVAAAAAAASDPPASFLCRARWGRLAWYDVRGPRSFVELLWALEELSATLCELCGAPAVQRETWERGIHTLCPRHAVDIAVAGPKAGDVYDRAWALLRNTQ